MAKELILLARSLGGIPMSVESGLSLSQPAARWPRDVIVFFWPFCSKPSQTQLLPPRERDSAEREEREREGKGRQIEKRVNLLCLII